MIRAVFLDSEPVGLATQRVRKSAEGDACRAWLEDLLTKGVRVYVPEIIDYEVRRELLREGKTSGVLRLDRLRSTARYLPLTTPALLLAADLWADTRRRGLATSDPKALDVDVILCAQALTLGLPRAEWVIATGNVAHLSRFAPAQQWNTTLP